MDREVERLLNQCAELTADPEIASEDAEKPLVEAVELLKLTESVAGFPEALAPENWLLCAEAALGVGNVKLAHSSLESFMIVQPCRDQFLARAYFAMGRVQSAYCAGLKAQELLDYTMMALNHVQHGLKVAAELGVAHRFLVYNGSVHLWNVARPLMATPSHAAELVPVLQATIKALTDAQEDDKSWLLQLNMSLARCMEAAGQRKEAGALLAGCGGLAQEGKEKEQLLQLQLHTLAEDAAAAKKLRDENGSKPRLKALLTAQWLRSSPAPVPNAADEILEAIVAVDKEMAAALRTEGDQAAVTAAVGQLKGATEDADVLLALATQAAAAGLLDLASHIANRCGTAKALAARVVVAYVRETVKIKRLDDGSAGPAQSEVYTRLMVGTRVECLKRLEEAVASARRTADPELITDGAPPPPTHLARVALPAGLADEQPL